MAINKLTQYLKNRHAKVGDFLFTKTCGTYEVLWEKDESYGLMHKQSLMQTVLDSGLRCYAHIQPLKLYRPIWEIGTIEGCPYLKMNEVAPIIQTSYIILEAYDGFKAFAWSASLSELKELAGIGDNENPTLYEVTSAIEVRLLSLKGRNGVIKIFESDDEFEWWGITYTGYLALEARQAMYRYFGRK